MHVFRVYTLAPRRNPLISRLLTPKPFFIYAEDDPDAVVLLRAALRKLHAEDYLIHCPEGDAVVACLRDAVISRSLPAFVLLDLKMPRRGGFDALRWIRLVPELRALPVIILTSSPLQEDVQLATALGATNYLVKPPSYEQLCALIDELLQRFMSEAASEQERFRP